MEAASPAERGSRVPPGLVEAGEYPTSDAGFERGLVVLSAGHPFWLLPAGQGFGLFVEPEHADEIREQLVRYDAEARGWPPVEPGRAPRASIEAGLAGASLWALAIMAVFAVQERRPGFLEARFALDSRATFSGHELWRPFTALWLHADPGHLGGNLLGGLFVFTAAAISLGFARGWAFTLTAAYVGNLLAAAAHARSPYVSLGASTAIFAALGVMTGDALRGCLRAARPWWNAAVPLGGGLAYLGLYGAGAAHADVMAHATGFGAGLLLGFLFGRDGRPQA
jgi:rhomboid protease GluP